MHIDQISVPEVYKESYDFRFFIKLFELALTKTNFDINNILDLYDPLRCPEHLLWMLADTMGYKFDDRLPSAYCRLVLTYFASMIRLKGCRDGVILACELNLAQFNILKYGEENDILFNRLEDTSIPVNSVGITEHPDEGYYDIVYFSDTQPVDACVEYVRPVGMYAFQHPGIDYNARTKISIDARLVNSRDLNISIGSTRIGHYSREDYARMQKMRNQSEHKIDYSHKREPGWKSNSEYEGQPDQPNMGYRALYNLQLCNNEHIVKSLAEPIFSLGYGPQDVSVMYPDNYINIPDRPEYNLRYDRASESSQTSDIETIDNVRTTSVTNPIPKLNNIMAQVGDAIQP